MNNKELELIGESIWNTYKSMASLIGEGVRRLHGGRPESRQARKARRGPGPGYRKMKKRPTYASPQEQRDAEHEEEWKGLKPAQRRRIEAEMEAARRDTQGDNARQRKKYGELAAQDHKRDQTGEYTELNKQGRP